MQRAVILMFMTETKFMLLRQQLIGPHQLVTGKLALIL